MEICGKDRHGQIESDENLWIALTVADRISAPNGCPTGLCVACGARLTKQCLPSESAIADSFSTQPVAAPEKRPVSPPPARKP